MYVMTSINVPTLIMTLPNRILLFFLLAASLQSCVGTDIIEDPVFPERITILPRIDSLSPGESVQLRTRFFDEFGREQEVAASWVSTDTSRVVVSETGMATGVSAGPVEIIASFNAATDTLYLNNDTVSNLPDPRSGTFSGANGYTAMGTARLEIQGDGKLHLVLESDFRTSAGPSLYLLLANHTNGNYSVTNGGNAVTGASAQITPTRMTNFTGTMDFIVPDDVLIDDYQFVVLYCTIGPVFGTAELN